jgi:hypothetical protein
MRGAVIYGPRDIRFEERPDPAIICSGDFIGRVFQVSGARDAAPRSLLHGSRC